MTWLRYRPVLAMVNILALELWQLLQYSYVCSSMMSVHSEGGGSVRDTRVSFTNVDVMSRLASVAGCRPFPRFVEVTRRWRQPYFGHHKVL